MEKESTVVIGDEEWEGFGQEMRALREALQKHLSSLKGLVVGAVNSPDAESDSA